MVEHKYCSLYHYSVLHLLLLFCNGACFSWDVLQRQNTIISNIFLFLFLYDYTNICSNYNAMQCKKKRERKCEWLYLQGIATHLPRYMKKLSALLFSFWAFKAKRDLPSMIFWFQDMPCLSHSNWVYGIFFTRFIIYQAKCQIAWKISSIPLLTELHSVKYHPLSIAMSKVHCKKTIWDQLRSLNVWVCLTRALRRILRCYRFS